MKKKLLVGVIAGLLVSATANAATINLTAASFDSPLWNGSATTFDLPDFNFSLNGENIISASLTGSWGITDTYPSGTTAHNEVWLDGIKVADTHDYSPDPYFTRLVPWSYTYSNFSTLLDGHLDYSVVQTSQYYVRLGQTTLNIVTAPVPEPETYAMLLAGLGLLSFTAKRRKQRV